MGTVTMDIIPPEFALRGSYRHLVTSGPENSNSTPSSPQQIPSSPRNNEETETLDEDDVADKSNDRNTNTLPLYHPSFANSILPSTSMSPSWYSASTQKNSFAKWMSPSFYYSRPATSVILPGQNSSSGERGDEEGENGGSLNDGLNPSTSTKGSFIPRDIVTRCLEYRIRRYSPKITPQRMRHVLQRFLKNMVLKANEET
jgi:hypothetical protein